MAIKNFLNIGVRPSLTAVLASYLNDRKLKSNLMDRNPRNTLLMVAARKEHFWEALNIL
jgi:hypothetical protein